jgi:hypothetical protein
MRSLRHAFEVSGDGTFFGTKGLGVAAQSALLSRTPTAARMFQRGIASIPGGEKGGEKHAVDELDSFGVATDLRIKLQRERL